MQRAYTAIRNHMKTEEYDTFDKWLVFGLLPAALVILVLSFAFGSKAHAGLDVTPREDAPIVMASLQIAEQPEEADVVVAAVKTGQAIPLPTAKPLGSLSFADICYAQEWGNILVATDVYGFKKSHSAVSEAKSILCAPGETRLPSAEKLKNRAQGLNDTLKRAKKEFDDAANEIKGTRPFPIILAEMRFRPLFMMAQMLAHQ